ncbi:MAG TPA: aminoglycoside 6-adenylyltransferase [Pyrinomonadaceae bacterium]|nr:aminoglycoside 6-adenylyltransferase [Pyrinomonadaceae bacterium]
MFTRPHEVIERDDKVVDQLIHWADSHDLIRAVILTSSRAIPHGSVDLFSDYDVILAMRSIYPFHADRTWLEIFGPVLAVYRDPPIDGGIF